MMRPSTTTTLRKMATMAFNLPMGMVAGMKILRVEPKGMPRRWNQDPVMKLMERNREGQGGTAAHPQGVALEEEGEGEAGKEAQASLLLPRGSETIPDCPLNVI
jgi:hypothetical protein